MFEKEDVKYSEIFRFLDFFFFKMESSTSIDFLCQSHKRIKYMEVKLWPKVLLGAWGTFWEHIGNIEGKKKRKIPPFPKPKRKKKKKKTGPLMHVEPSHWLHEIIIFSKLFVTNRGPGLITPL
jgi:hypothetical protein